MPINAVSVAVIMEVIGLIVKHGVPAVKAMIETWEKDEITLEDVKALAHKLERELVRDRQNACGYRPRQKDECRFCKHVGRYSSYTYQTTYFCNLHNFCVAARGICNDFETNIPGERTNDSAGVA